MSRAYPPPLAETRSRHLELVRQSIAEAQLRLIEHKLAGNHVPDEDSWVRNMAGAIAQKKSQDGRCPSSRAVLPPSGLSRFASQAKPAATIARRKTA